MSRAEDLLADILEELRALRNDVSVIQSVLPLIRPTYDADDSHSELQDIRTAIQDLGERITGPIGYHLGDVHSKLEDMDGKLGLIDINTTP